MLYLARDETYQAFNLAREISRLKVWRKAILRLMMKCLRISARRVVGLAMRFLDLAAFLKASIEVDDARSKNILLGTFLNQKGF